MSTGYEETLKPEEVETVLDLRFFRPIAHVFVSFARVTPLGPSSVTLLSLVVGLSAASLLRYPSVRLLVPAALLFVLYRVLDCADGQLARSRDEASRLGRILGGISSLIVTLATGAGMAAHVAAEGVDTALPVLGIGSVILQGACFDYVRGRFLRRSKSTYREGDDLEETEAEIARGGSPLGMSLDRIYVLFLRAQRVLGRGLPGAPTDEQTGDYAESLRPAAKAWAFLGPSTHIALMAVFLCFGGVSAYLWLRLTLGNVIAIALYAEQVRRERPFAPARPKPAELVEAALAKPSSPATPMPPPAPSLESNVEAKQDSKAAPISFRPPPMGSDTYDD